MTSEMGLSYRDLLSLYRGKSSVVEQLTDAERAALAIETPLKSFLRQADSEGSPRHVLLTGNAGDGKSFAAVTAGVEHFSIVVDASAGEVDRPSSPIEDLARRLEVQLGREERLLVAINRGQLERLDAVVRQGKHGALGSLLEAARRQATINEVWAKRDEQCALIDLGLLDTANDRILDAMLAKVTAATGHDDLHPHTRTAFTTAQASLETKQVREYLRGVIRLAQARGHHPTMRQLWSFFAYLSTGARDAYCDVPASLSDSVGARLFSSDAEGQLFEYARDLADPAAIPQPELTRMALIGMLGSTILAAAKDLTDLRTETADGEMLTRVAAVHGVPGATRPSLADGSFRAVVARLREKAPGWDSWSSLTDKLLNNIYMVLGLWSRGSNYPAWQTLCFDSARFARATTLASDEIDPRSLQVALPRPSPWGEAALQGAWIPPFVWLATKGTAMDQRSGKLRLSPRLFEVLYSDVDSHISRTDALTLRRWLSLIPAEDRRSAPLRLATRDSSAPLQFLEDPLGGHDTLTWEGQA